MSGVLGVPAPQEATGASRKLLEQASPYLHYAVPTAPKAPVRPLCTVPVKKCWVWSCFVWDTGCLTTVYSKHTQKKKKFTSGRYCIFQMPLFFFFLVITLLSLHHYFLGFCLFHRVCLPIMAKPEGKTHNLAKSFQSICLLLLRCTASISDSKKG